MICDLTQLTMTLVVLIDLAVSRELNTYAIISKTKYKKMEKEIASMLITQPGLHSPTDLLLPLFAQPLFVAMQTILVT